MLNVYVSLSYHFVLCQKNNTRVYNLDLPFHLAKHPLFFIFFWFSCLSLAPFCLMTLACVCVTDLRLLSFFLVVCVPYACMCMFVQITSFVFFLRSLFLLLTEKKELYIDQRAHAILRFSPLLLLHFFCIWIFMLYI